MSSTPSRRAAWSRAPPPPRARSVEIALTPEGRHLFEEADATRRACLAPVFTDLLDQQDLEALSAVWRKLKAHKGA